MKKFSLNDLSKDVHYRLGFYEDQENTKGFKIVDIFPERIEPFGDTTIEDVILSFFAEKNSRDHNGKWEFTSHNLSYAQQTDNYYYRQGAFFISDGNDSEIESDSIITRDGFLIKFPGDVVFDARIFSPIRKHEYESNIINNRIRRYTNNKHIYSFEFIFYNLFIGALKFYHNTGYFNGGTEFSSRHNKKDLIPSLLSLVSPFLKNNKGKQKTREIMQKLEYDAENSWLLGPDREYMPRRFVMSPLMQELVDENNSLQNAGYELMNAASHIKPLHISLCNRTMTALTNSNHEILEHKRAIKTLEDNFLYYCGNEYLKPRAQGRKAKLKTLK